MYLILLELSGFLFLNFFPLTIAKCPKLVPTEIEGRCYRFQVEPRLSFDDATDNCPKNDEQAVLVSIRTQAVLDQIQQRAKKFAVDKLKNAIFWMGLFMEDRNTRKAVKDRNWKWPYDDSEIIQKDYPLWEEEGGPDNSGLACSAISPADDYKVKAIDCSGPKIPLICMMKEGDPCKHDVVPYMVFGKYCIGSVAGALPYDKMRGACTPGEPTAFKVEMQQDVMTCAKSVFLGGGIFMNLKRGLDGKFRDLSDNWEPPEDWWEEGEPRDYDCVSLTFQPDWSLKLKTINCKFMASFMCILNGKYITPGAGSTDDHLIEFTDEILGLVKS